MQRAANFVINNGLTAFIFIMSKKFVLLFVLVAFAGSTAEAQKRSSMPIPKKPAATATPTLEKVAAKPTPAPPKKNERPLTGTSKNSAKPTSGDGGDLLSDAPYRYEFSQPDFIIDRVIIEHNETGKGRISFSKKGYDELISDPIHVSESTLVKLKAAFDALNFVDSTEDYQFERDFAHMGNIAITLKKNGRERTAKYNWTSNKEAKFLMDEYRRIGNQFIWMFDINLARENQPLETPRLLDSFYSMVNRNEIADPTQMIPFLQALSTDERIPLIGRNHAGKIVKQIEKQKK
jgi:hypothetical protein